MKDVMELLRAKEQELLKVRRQVEALRVALPLLSDEDPNHPANRPTSLVPGSKGTGNLG
ncbi:MAG: hypothetical protein ABR880_17050 [Candidatus Sulfotelmatobacter sp.]|jgi:hypothetical protein